MISPARPLTGLAAVAILAFSLATGAEAAPRTLSFAGYTWKVRPTADAEPGPNHWSSANAWLDENGALHLKISRKKGLWYAVELATVEHLGFGTYQFWVDTRVDNFDPNIVFGIFNYPAKQGLDGTNEIDVEFGKWGDPDAPQLDDVVYPAKKGKGPTGWAFHIADTSVQNTQRFTWSSQGVLFQSLAGHQNHDVGEYARWDFKPKNASALVPQNPMPLHLNLWLSGGNAPQDGKEVEVVIRDFTFTPAAP